MRIVLLTKIDFLHALCNIADEVRDYYGYNVVVTCAEPGYLLKDADMVFSWFYPHIIPSEYIHDGMYNCHISYLPFNAGAMPNLWAIQDGTPAGWTIHRIDAGIDTGEILWQGFVEVSASDTGIALYDRLVEASYLAFAEFVHTACGRPDDPIERRIPVEYRKERRTYHNSRDIEIARDLLRGMDNHEVAAVMKFYNRMRACVFPPNEGGWFDYVNNNGQVSRIFIHDISVEQREII